AADGALFQRAYGVTHPSEPNYLALFSGSLQGVRSDSCPHHFTVSDQTKTFFSHDFGVSNLTPVSTESGVPHGRSSPTSSFT
ncbi:MAG: hypothetical protein WBL23_05495, partial [Salinisphaera sp.]